MNDQIASTAGPSVDQSRSRGVIGRRARLGAAITLATLTAAISMIGVAAISVPSGRLASVVPLSLPQEIEADRLLASGGGGEALARAEAASHRAMALAPGRASVWVREAYLDAWRNGRLTNAGARALDKSYQISSLGPDVTLSRVKLIFEYWPVMPEQLRNQALEEFAAAAPHQRDQFESLVAGLKSPEGQLAAGMALAEHDTREALARSN